MTENFFKKKQVERQAKKKTNRKAERSKKKK
jgi:hypothetical protein